MPALQRITFEIEPARIDQAARTLEAHMQSPALTAVAISGAVSYQARRSVPATAMACHPRAAVCTVRIEARGIVLHARQTVQGAGDDDILAFQRGRQTLR